MSTNISHATSRPPAVILEEMAKAIDITREQSDKAEALYKTLGEWLSAHSDAEVHVYVQGSFLLGTIVRPVSDDGEYDIDLVFRREIARKETSQAKVRTSAVDLLDQFSEANDLEPPEELGRCERLVMKDDGFHVDVLAAIPDDEHEDDRAILLSDRDLFRWEHSNPLGYADWFYERMSEVFASQRSALAIKLSRKVDDVPRWMVRTPLQRAIQLLKRHRDIHFAEDPSQQPSSMLLTTLAALAYKQQGSVERAVIEIAADMPNYIERRDGKYWVENPAHPEENFCDKWNTDPARKQKFHDWLDQLSSELGLSIEVDDGLDKLRDVLKSGFGAGLVDLGLERYAKRVAKLAGGEVLGVGADGTLTSAKRNRPAPTTTFHGETSQTS
jgi:hypothetical protein